MHLKCEECGTQYDGGVQLTVNGNPYNQNSSCPKCAEEKRKQALPEPRAKSLVGFCSECPMFYEVDLDDRGNSQEECNHPDSQMYDGSKTTGHPPDECPLRKQPLTIQFVRRETRERQS